MARIDDGHSTTISFTAEGSGLMGVAMYEKEVTPPGIQGGGPNDTTTMRNTTWRTRSPKTLKTLSEATIVIAYDPDLYTQLNALVNVNQEIQITFPDSSVLTFWGWIDEFSPNPIVEGEQPTADVTVICSNQNAAGVETAPIMS